MKTLIAAAFSVAMAVSPAPGVSWAEDIQAARENQDVQAPRENQDVQAPRENQDVQAPRDNQNVQSPRS